MSRQSTFIPISVAALLFIVLAYVNLFDGIGTNHIRNWDEARHGINALEMIKSGNYVVHTWLGETDYWNLKPPLSFLPMIAGFKLFGPGILGLRFFSSVFSLATLFLTGLLCRKISDTPTALLSMLILLTCNSFFQIHGSVTGDPEAFHVFLYVAALTAVLSGRTAYPKYYFASLCAALDFLAKSFHAAPLCLTIATLFFLEHRLTKKSVLHACGCLAVFCAPVLVWAVQRYQFDQFKFFHEMFVRDVAARIASPVEGHFGAPWYQWYYLVKLLENYAPWIVLSLLSGLASAVLKYKGMIPVAPLPAKRLLYTLAGIIALPLCIFSAAASKLGWYVWCVYPFMAVLLALPVSSLLSALFKNSSSLRKSFRLTAFLLFCALCVSEFLAYDTKTRTETTFRDPVQTILRDSAKKAGDKHVRAYIQNGQWEPRHILAAMLADKAELLPGGKEAFDQDDDPNKLLVP